MGRNYIILFGCVETVLSVKLTNYSYLDANSQDESYFYTKRLKIDRFLLWAL